MVGWLVQLGKPSSHFIGRSWQVKLSRTGATGTNLFCSTFHRKSPSDKSYSKVFLKVQAMLSANESEESVACQKNKQRLTDIADTNTDTYGGFLK